MSFTSPTVQKLLFLDSWIPEEINKIILRAKNCVNDLGRWIQQSVGSH